MFIIRVYNVIHDFVDISALCADILKSNMLHMIVAR